MSSRWVKVATRQSLSPGDFEPVEVDGKKLVLYNVGGKLYATDNTCAHQGGPLGQGLFENEVVTCPWHAWQFDVCTGQSVFDPTMKIATFPVKVEGDDVLVEV